MQAKPTNNAVICVYVHGLKKPAVTDFFAIQQSCHVHWWLVLESGIAEF